MIGGSWVNMIYFNAITSSKERRSRSSERLDFFYHLQSRLVAVGLWNISYIRSKFTWRHGNLHRNLIGSYVIASGD